MTSLNAQQCLRQVSQRSGGPLLLLQGSPGVSHLTVKTGSAHSPPSSKHPRGAHKLNSRSRAVDKRHKLRRNDLIRVSDSQGAGTKDSGNRENGQIEDFHRKAGSGCSSQELHSYSACFDLFKATRTRLQSPTFTLDIQCFTFCL